MKNYNSLPSLAVNIYYFCRGSCTCQDPMKNFVHISGSFTKYRL